MPRTWQRWNPRPQPCQRLFGHLPYAPFQGMELRREEENPQEFIDQAQAPWLSLKATQSHVARSQTQAYQDHAKGPPEASGTPRGKNVGLHDYLSGHRNQAKEVAAWAKGAVRNNSSVLRRHRCTWQGRLRESVVDYVAEAERSQVRRGRAKRGVISDRALRTWPLRQSTSLP